MLGKLNMIIVRDILTYAGVRKLEWVMSGFMIHRGINLIYSGDEFNSRPVYSELIQWFDMQTWGWLFVIFSTFRLIVLILNGTHIKQSSEMRMLLAAGSFLIICAWLVGLRSSGASVTGGDVYFWLAIGELGNVWQASSDTNHKHKAAQNGRNTGSSSGA